MALKPTEKTSLCKAEIAQSLGRNISEVFHMIATLERRGWVVADRAERGRIVLIAQIDAPGNINFSVCIGSTVNLFDTASGQVLLAFRSEEARAQLLAEYHLLSSVYDTHGDWHEAVERVRARGYAHAPNQQVRGVANLIPIWRRDGLIEAALVVPYLEVLGVSRGPSQKIVCEMMAEVA